MQDNIPDAPFRIGVTGKYKLLIRSVTPKSDGYEYCLVDAEDREYRALSDQNYPEMQLLRCMFFFEVKAARLIVSDVAICKKQDLAVPIPKTKKASPKTTKKTSKNRLRKRSTGRVRSLSWVSA